MPSAEFPSTDEDQRIRRALPHTRRQFLTVSGAAMALAFGTNLAGRTTASADPQTLRSDPFTLGIASGDPLPNAVVLWTRLAPQLFDPMGGMPNQNFPVDWQVASDENFRHIVRSGRATARPEYRHAVHVDARGLQPARVYYYRFKAGSYLSPVGRTRTAPALDARPNRLRFGFASCQAYPDGYFSPYQHLVNEDLDVVFFLGDYIYENAVNEVGGERHDTSFQVPDIFQYAPDTLDLYRLHYSLYKADPDLQAAHAAFPWILTWDDHEVQDNYAGDTDKAADPVEDFLVQRANAYRAYWEHQPLRAAQEPNGPDALLYRRFHFGDLMQVDVLDTRQYRSDQSCGDGVKAGCSEAADPARTLTGPKQMDWLLNGLGRSSSRWNVIANQVMMAEQRTTLDDPPPVNMDAWDGYTADRQKLFDSVLKQHVDGLVVITGDTHTNYASDLKQNFDDMNSATVGVEFVGTSISSGRDGSDTTDGLELALKANPHIKFDNFQRGYVACEVNRNQVRADYRVVPYVTRRGAPIWTRASFITERANPGLETV